MAERNKLTKEGLGKYTRELYEEANIIGTTVDMGWPMGDQRLDCFPCRVLRLFQMDPVFDRLIGQCYGFIELKAKFEKEVTAAAEAGYIGIKCHVLEKCTCTVRLVSDHEAEGTFASATKGNAKDLETVYLAIFAGTLLLCQKLDIPIHIHTGSTGGTGNGLIHN